MAALNFVTVEQVLRAIRLAEEFHAATPRDGGELRSVEDATPPTPEQQSARSALRSFLLGLSREAVQELWAIMYVGRDGRRRFSFDKRLKEVAQLYHDNQSAESYLGGRYELPGSLRKGLELLGLTVPSKVEPPPPQSIEEVFHGSAEMQTQIAEGDGRGPAVSHEILAQQLRDLDETGQEGEKFFNRWLLQCGHAKESYEWVSERHARAAYDFHVRSPRWENAPGGLFVDVKATTGGFYTVFHLSAAEVRWAATHPNYRVARVYGISSDSPQVTILDGVHGVAKEIAEKVLTVLPEHVNIDSFEIKVSRGRPVGGDPQP
ncbi:MAG: hypothetical protein JWL77_6762 [Chthonomonadaceae bacterium]|nr:hypothetical protein [Chthonomonadaceae bacterium]